MGRDVDARECQAEDLPEELGAPGEPGLASDSPNPQKEAETCVREQRGMGQGGECGVLFCVPLRVRSQAESWKLKERRKFWGKPLWQTDKATKEIRIAGGNYKVVRMSFLPPGIFKKLVRPFSFHFTDLDSAFPARTWQFQSFPVCRCHFLALDSDFYSIVQPRVLFNQYFCSIPHVGRWHCSKCPVKTAWEGEGHSYPLGAELSQVCRGAQSPGDLSGGARKRESSVFPAPAMAALAISPLPFGYLHKNFGGKKNCKMFSNTTALGSEVLAVKAVFRCIL